MTFALAIIGGAVLTSAIALTLLFLDHLAGCEGNDEENYPSE